MTTAVMKMAAWQRRAATVLVPLAVVGAISTVSYFPGAHGSVGAVAAGLR